MLCLGGVVATGSIVVLVLGLTASTGNPSRPVASPIAPSSRPSSSLPARDLPVGQLSDESLNRALRTASPSNLDPQLEKPLLVLATAALLADLTGAGRERFSDYLPGEPLTWIYRDVRVQGAVACRIDDVRVETHLLWAGVSPDGQHLERQTALIRLRYFRQSWRPLRS